MKYARLIVIKTAQVQLPSFLRHVRKLRKITQLIQEGRLQLDDLSEDKPKVIRALKKLDPRTITMVIRSRVGKKNRPWRRIRLFDKKRPMVRMVSFKCDTEVQTCQRLFPKDRIRSLERILGLPLIREYEYSPVDEWRYVDILPAANFEDDIHCRMRTLPESSKFVALSYAWGETFSDGSHLTDVGTALLSHGRNHVSLEYLRAIMLPFLP